MTEIIYDLVKHFEENENPSLQRQITQLLMRIESQDERLNNMAEEVITMREIIDRLTMQPAIAGTFPPITEINKAWVQIFHTPNLTLNQKKAGNTEWSLKVEYWHRGKKQEGINIALYSALKLRNLLIEKNAKPKLIQHVETWPDHVLGGVVRRKLPLGGRGYECSQIAFLIGHEADGIDQMAVGVIIDEAVMDFTQFKPSNAVKARGSLCVATWQPTRK